MEMTIWNLVSRLFHSSLVMTMRKMKIKDVNLCGCASIKDLVLWLLEIPIIQTLNFKITIITLIREIGKKSKSTQQHLAKIKYLKSYKMVSMLIPEFGHGFLVISKR